MQIFLMQSSSSSSTSALPLHWWNCAMQTHEFYVFCKLLRALKKRSVWDLPAFRVRTCKLQFLVEAVQKRKLLATWFHSSGYMDKGKFTVEFVFTTICTSLRESFGTCSLFDSKLALMLGQQY